jgi:MoaA/NifB/PqqE/SkfB family radical SAM enzyme
MSTLLAEKVTALQGRETDPAPYPRQLVLDWTDYCNAKCFFCWREKYEQEIGGMGEFIPFAKLKKLEDVLSKVEIFGISSGIGEPLLHPELDEILTWLYGINPSIRLQTVTNGTTLTAAKAGWFAGHLDWLSVSLNAANGDAHMRDMFPHLAKRGINADKRFDLHVRHLTEFLAALPLEDRRRVRFQMVTHRYNVKDVVDFVRLVHRMGGFQAVFTNIAAHPETIDWSLYWIKDQYNDLIEEACEVGTRLGVQVHSVRFFTGVKPVFDLDKVCRDPIDIAYISRSSHASPCCHWTEAQIPVDYYNDDEGFEKYWNSDLLQRLRHKRDFASCRVCGMSRIFDETSFHFSPKLKQILIKEGRIAEINSENDFPDAGLVRACVDNRLDLPSIRRTLLGVGLPVGMAGEIELKGLAALPALDQACWDAFQKAEVPLAGANIPLAGPFLGIGWGIPIHEHQNKVAARWISAAQQASVFVRVQPGAACELAFTIHHIHPAELQSRLGITVCGRALEMRISPDVNGRTLLCATVPEDLTTAYEGRLWVHVGCHNGGETPAGHVSLVRLALSDPANAHVTRLEQLVAEKDLQLSEQSVRLAELQHLVVTKDEAIEHYKVEATQLGHQLQAVYGSRSWRLTAPLRRVKGWLARNH